MRDQWYVGTKAVKERETFCEFWDTVVVDVSKRPGHAGDRPFSSKG